MLFFRRAQLARVFSYYVLFASCAIVAFNCLWTIRETYAHSVFNPRYPTHQRIPKKIWYKLGPHGMSEDIRNWTSSCINLNPGYEVVFLNDETGDHYVQRFFASRPDIVATYLGLTVPIVKADILRYLLLYNEGGIWSDLDISCEGVPIDEWIPDDYKRRTGLVVGWEFDYGWPGEIVRQFASWTIMAQAGSPHMMQVIEDILEIIHEILEENKVSVENATLAMMGNVVDFSGPRRMTHGIYKSLGKQLNRTIEESDLNQILQPKLVGDVLIMPGRSFAASANTYKPEEAEHLPPKLVTHHYAGTWRNDHGGEV